MTATTTMTIRVSEETRAKLDRLASGMRRSRSFLAAEALTAYVERELQIIEGIQRGLVDVENGRTIPHDEAMDQLDAMIEGMRSPKQ